MTAIAFLKEFIRWYENNKDNRYLPHGSNEQMFSLEYLKSSIEDIEKSV
jgi:hypothetical protein